MSRLLAGIRAVIISTGDDRDIGAAVAARFREEGAEVRLAGPGDELDFDGRPDRVRAVLEQGQADLGSLDAVVNATTRWWVGPIGELGPGDWNGLLEANATLAVELARATQALLPGAGSLTSISHVWAAATGAEVGFSGASKAVLGPLTKALAQAGASRGLRANLVLTGLVDTPSRRVLAEARARASGREADTAFQREVGRTSLGRAAAPDEIAKVAAFLASSRARAITGATVVVDGGLLHA